MQNLSLDMMNVPLSQFVNGDELISGVHIDFREEAGDPVSDIKLLLIPLGSSVNLLLLLFVMSVGCAGEEKEDTNYDDCVN